MSRAKPVSVIKTQTLPMPATRVGTVCGPCQNPRDDAGTVICHMTDRWGTRAVVLLDTGTIEYCSGLTTVGIGWYAL